MNLLKAITTAKDPGSLVVITKDSVQVFDDLDDCEAYSLGLNGEPFAVLRLLWSGGANQSEAKASPPSLPTPAQTLHEARKKTALEYFTRKQVESDSRTRAPDLPSVQSSLPRRPRPTDD